MSTEAYAAAVELAKQDAALMAAMDAGESMTVSMNEDGGVNVSCGGESVDFAPEDLMGESPSIPPPPPAGMAE